MINYNIVNDNDVYKLKVDGHANYGTYGTDIVCASVSTALILSVNLIEKMNLSYNIANLVCDEGNFLLEIKIDNDIVFNIIKNLEETLEELSIQYPKNIKKR